MALSSAPSPSRSSTRTPRQRIRKDDRTWTAETFAPYDDGHQWRKYGEKKLSSSRFPRFYYRCTYKNDMKCPATKQVQQKDFSDPPLFSVTYFSHHTCNAGGSSSPPVAAPDEPAGGQPSSRKGAVSISFSSCAAADEQTAFPSHLAAMPSPAPVKMEADDFPETSGSSSTGALSRTLLPIGPSRCIEYFQFL